MSQILEDVEATIAVNTGPGGALECSAEDLAAAIADDFRASGWRPERWRSTTVEGERGPIRCQPDSDRNVLVFLNGHVAIDDDAGRKGGGWGIRLGWCDPDTGVWFADGVRNETHVTHWMELPGPPKRTGG